MEDNVHGLEDIVHGLEDNVHGLEDNFHDLRNCVHGRWMSLDGLEFSEIMMNDCDSVKRLGYVL